MNESSPITEVSLPELLGRVYEEAPVTQRGQIVEHLLKPLGLLALVGVANGIFAKLTWRDGWHSFKIPAESIAAIEAHHVVALAHRVQQVSSSSLESLGQVILQSPVIASSAAAAMLLSVLHKQSSSRPE